MRVLSRVAVKDKQIFYTSYQFLSALNGGVDPEITGLGFLT